MKNKNKTLLSDLNIVMMGATGAVGGETLKTLLTFEGVKRLSLLGRRPVSGLEEKFVDQHKINIFERDSYTDLLPGHQIAICTLGVGEPSKMSKEDFLKIDKIAVLDFAVACKKAGIRHFQLLSSVGVSEKSSSFFLRTKGELIRELEALEFERLSIFQPSMILTPTNRYGWSQGLVLRIWPLLKPLLFGGLRKYRGVPVEVLGRAIAKNILITNEGKEGLFWDDFYDLAQ